MQWLLAAECKGCLGVTAKLTKLLSTLTRNEGYVFIKEGRRAFEVPEIGSAYPSQADCRGATGAHPQVTPHATAKLVASINLHKNSHWKKLLIVHRPPVEASS